MVKFWIKTFGWLVVSGLLFFGSCLVSGCTLMEAFISTSIACLLKTPLYAGYEWGFHKWYPKDYPHAEPLEHDFCPEVTITRTKC